MSSPKIFLTGATGFVGGELVKKLLINNRDSEFWLLIRDSRQKSAVDRFEALLQELDGDQNISNIDFRSQIHLVVGDLTEERFGLSIDAFKDLSSKINVIHHCAATINLVGNWDRIYKINYFGTKQVLELAKLAKDKGGFQRLNYLSTAYVAGKRFGIIYENELESKKGFTNSYERAKFEAEVMLEKVKSELPITIYRPSIILGHSKTGVTPKFNVIYEPMRLAYLGKLKRIPGGMKGSMDVVPIDYVCDAIVALSIMEKAAGKTFHLSAGQNKSKSARELATTCLKYVEKFSKENKRPYTTSNLKFIHPLVLMTICKVMIFLSSGKRKKFYEKVLSYCRYSYYYKDFNTDEAVSLLSPLGINAPEIYDYVDVLVKYAVDANFNMKKQ